MHPLISNIQDFVRIGLNYYNQVIPILSLISIPLSIIALRASIISHQEARLNNIIRGDERRGSDRYVLNIQSVVIENTGRWIQPLKKLFGSKTGKARVSVQTNFAPTLSLDQDAEWTNNLETSIRFVKTYDTAPGMGKYNIEIDSVDSETIKESLDEFVYQSEAAGDNTL